MTDLWLTKFSAIFQPKRTDDLQSGVADVIGRRMVWQRAWIIEDGQYKGEWACAALEHGIPFAWAPESDLVESEEIAEATAIRHFKGQDRPISELHAPLVREVRR